MCVMLGQCEAVGAAQRPLLLRPTKMARPRTLTGAAASLSRSPSNRPPHLYSSAHCTALPVVHIQVHVAREQHTRSHARCRLTWNQITHSSRRAAMLAMSPVLSLPLSIAWPLSLPLMLFSALMLLPLYWLLQCGRSLFSSGAVPAVRHCQYHCQCNSQQPSQADGDAHATATSTSPHTSHNTSPCIIRVCIIGAGFAGNMLVHELQQYNAKQQRRKRCGCGCRDCTGTAVLQLLLFDEKDYFEYTPAILRCMMRPAHFHFTHRHMHQLRFLGLTAKHATHKQHNVSAAATLQQSQQHSSDAAQRDSAMQQADSTVATGTAAGGVKLLPLCKVQALSSTGVYVNDHYIPCHIAVLSIGSYYNSHIKPTQGRYTQRADVALICS